MLITDTAEYLHEYITQPSVRDEDRMAHAIHFLSTALKYVPNSIFDSQLAAIEAVRAISATGKQLIPIPHQTIANHGIK